MNYYDSLFMLNTPAGWVEYRKKFPYKESYAWDRCDFLKHGEKIPKAFTDVDTPAGADVNAGLLLVKPDKKEYDSMIKELKQPIEKWMGDKKYHKGFYNFDFDNKSGKTISTRLTDRFSKPLGNEVLLGSTTGGTGGVAKFAMSGSFTNDQTAVFVLE